MSLFRKARLFVASFFIIGLVLYIIFIQWTMHRHLDRGRLGEFGVFFRKIYNQLELSETISHNNTKFTQKGLRIGNFQIQCNKYPKDLPPVVGSELIHPNTTWATCKFENLCLTSTGEFVLFGLPSEQMVNHDNPWVYTQGRLESTRGLFHVDVQPCVKNSHNNVTHQNPECHPEEMPLSNQFEWIEKPVVALHRYATGNVGHFFLENLTQILTLLMQYNRLGYSNEPKGHITTLDNVILYLDNVLDLSGENWRASWKYPEEDALKISMEGAQLVSSNRVLQMCGVGGNGTVVVGESCGKEHVEKQKRRTLQKCFSQFHVGLTIGFFNLPYGREMMTVQMRNVVYSRLNIVPHPTEESMSNVLMEYLQKKDVVIAFHKKPPSGKHGAAIANVDEVMTHLSNVLPQEDFMKSLLKHKKLKIELVNLMEMNLQEQIKYFSNVDVYITDQGSASYYSLFMRDETSVIVAPVCETNGKCNHGLTYRLQTYTNVHVYNVLEFTKYHPVKCQARPVPSNPNNCDAILPLDVIHDNVKVFLKNRYRNMLEG